MESWGSRTNLQHFGPGEIELKTSKECTMYIDPQVRKKLRSQAILTPYLFRGFRGDKGVNCRREGGIINALYCIIIIVGHNFR